MQVNLVNISELAQDGAEFLVTDQAIWQGPLTEFGLPCEIIEPIQAKVFLLPQPDGCLIRGELTGKVSLPCDRCAEPAEVALSHSFEDYEALPDPEDLDPHDLNQGAEELDESGLLFEQNGNLYLNLAELLWQEFSMALPIKPLCASGCKGICQVCGNNLNLGACNCAPQGLDPRLAILRNLKIQSGNK